MLTSQVLVLNRSYLPVHVTTVKEAICLVYRGIAKFVDAQYSMFDFKSWAELSVAKNEPTIGLIDRAIRVPKVIILQFYDQIPRRNVRFSRLNIYLRDQNTCQYCHRRFTKAELNLDHVIPISRGGKTTWDNVVCSCIPCNLKKGGRTPEQARMKLLKTPVRPHWSIFFKLISKPVFHDEWKPYLNMVDYSYWNAELED